ncbi:fasciclin domain containing lipoprotein [Nitzschia inconspicua]|uniref:Fasciclin domain containing lipoprotein n=1 Tax=Nitzschia inconspicua TaxID=303405 RepID=A0A9K3PWX9_9STRA|nr:fasciclin domain containing lipoprotein [Nitzschia inconspicua]
MRVGIPSTAFLFLGAAVVVGPVASQNIRSRLVDDAQTYQRGISTEAKVRRIVGIEEPIKRSGSRTKTSSKNSHHHSILHRNEIEEELERIFSEDLDHWDRMLEVSSLPPSVPPTAKPPPTGSPSIEVNVDTPSTTPTYLATTAPVDVRNPSYPPSTTHVPASTPTVRPSTSTTAPTAYVPTSNTAGPTVLPATTWDILSSRPEEFSTLISVSEAVGFDEALKSDEDRTLFAPTNDAFNTLIPADLLEKYFDFETWTNEYISRLLSCHDIVGSIIFSFQVQNGTKVLPCVDFIDPSFLITTPPLQISKDTMPIPANVTETDLLASNGVVHVVDQVLTNSFLRLPFPAAANTLGGFSILMDLIDVAGLSDLFSGPGPFTVFAPTDEVFRSLGDGFIEELKADPEVLRKVLLNHVVADIIIPCCQFDGATYESAAGFPVLIENVDVTEPRNFTVNGVDTIPALTGLLASNAKVNAISGILVLPSATVSPASPPTNPPIPAASTTWDIIASRPEDFATFIAASEATGFDIILQEATDRTLFVPNEEAFGAATPDGLLEKYFDFDTWTHEYIEVLLYCHELTGALILSTDLVNGTISPCMDLIDPVVVVSIPPPTLSKGTMPEPADIVEVDLIADNGVVHVIDQVITNSFLRFNVIEAGTFAGGYSILLELLKLTGLDEFASGPGPFTLFAPPDEVFQSYGQEFIDSLKADINGTTTILLNHVVPNLIIPCCLGETSEFFSAAGESLVLANYNPNNPSDYTVNDIATIPSGTDLLTSNAKVNTISDILIPKRGDSPTISPTLSDVSIPPATGEPSSGETIIPSLGETSLTPESEVPTESEPTPPPLPVETVWDVILASEDQFNTFIAIAETVGYDELLRTSPEITVFAPNEDAFSNVMPPDLLVKYFSVDEWTNEYIINLLTCHDINGAAILSSELNNDAEFASCLDLIDPDFRFSSPPPIIEKNTMPFPANIVGPDQESLNGVVHTVDQLLTTSFLRFDMPAAAEELGTFTILLELVVLTDLLTFVGGEGPFTIFAPSDSVFQRYGTEFIEGLKMDSAGTRDLLLNHVVADQIVPCCLTERTEFTSAAGFPLVLESFSVGDPNVFTVNGVDTVPTLTNFLTSNAKINEITDFLLPPQLQSAR